MIIKKHNNDYETYDITIQKEDKTLRVYQLGMDPNLSCQYEGYVPISKIQFEICEEDETLYPIFNKLYENIISGNILGENPSDEKTQERMEENRNLQWYSDIVTDDVITVLCDAYPKSCPNILKIYKEVGKIILDFSKVDGMEYKSKNCISINIRQSGSRLYDFCHPFNTLFSELQNVPEVDEQQVLKLEKDSNQSHL